jgi:membrane protein implicated in regulation of membrane protease activity
MNNTPESKPKNKWYFKTPLLVTAFLCVGPLALPLLWFNPRFTKKTKVIVSVIVLILTYYLGVLFFKSVETNTEYCQQLNQLGS